MMVNSRPRYNVDYSNRVLEKSVDVRAEGRAREHRAVGAASRSGVQVLLPFVLGFAAPFLISACTRFLRAYAEVIYRDTVPLLVVLVFAAFTAIALRRLPGRIGFVAAGLYLGATLGAVLDVLVYPDPERQLLGEVLGLWWFAAPGILGGVMLGKTPGRKRVPGTGKQRGSD